MAKALDQARRQHQGEAGGQRRRANFVIEAQRGRAHEGLILSEIDRRRQQDRQKQRRRRARQRFHDGAQADRNPVEQRRHAHVLAAPLRYDGAEHRQPEKRDRSEFVRPGQGMIEQEAGDDPGQQYRHFREHGEGGQRLRDEPEPPVEPRRKRGLPCRGRIHPNLPTAASSKFQPCSPNLPRQSA